jgi:hypothetical protein
VEGAAKIKKPVIPNVDASFDALNFVFNHWLS